MYLFFDTETTGLPKNWQAPASDTLNWPRLVQLSWAWYDINGEKWEYYDYIIKPVDFIIPIEASKIHRISQEKAETEGHDLVKVLNFFNKQVKEADTLIAHNIEFDEKIISAEFIRNNIENNLLKANKICTMKTTASVCRIANNRGSYKWPNLNELHFHLFKENFSEAHNALVDVFACARCFFALKKQGFKF